MSAPVVLVHGLGGAPAEWDAVAAELRAQGREVSCPELPGHGTRRREAFSWAAAVAEVRAAVADCAEPPILVGRELGGQLAIAAAAGTRGGGGRGGGADGAAPLELRALLAAGVGTEILGWLLDSYRIASATSALLPDGGKAIGNWAGDSVTGRSGSRDTGGTILGPALGEIGAVDVRSSLGRVTAPVVVVNGSRDRFRLQERALVRAARDGRLVKMPGERFAEAVADASAFAALIGGLDA